MQKKKKQKQSDTKRSGQSHEIHICCFSSHSDVQKLSRCNFSDSEGSLPTARSSSKTSGRYKKKKKSLNLLRTSWKLSFFPLKSLSFTSFPCVCKIFLVLLRSLLYHYQIQIFSKSRQDYLVTCLPETVGSASSNLFYFLLVLSSFNPL